MKETAVCVVRKRKKSVREKEIANTNERQGKRTDRKKETKKKKYHA